MQCQRLNKDAIWCPLILFLLYSASLFSSAARTQSALYAFLKDEIGSRGAALGGAAVALTGDVDDFFYNSATLSTVEKRQIAFVFEKHVLDVNAGSLAFSLPANAITENVSGTVGVALHYIHYGEFERTDVAGNTIGSFSAANLLLRVGYSNQLDTLFYYGIGIEYIGAFYEAYSATALAVSAGILYLLPEHRTTFGLAIQHVGATLSSTDPSARQRLPIDARIGISHRPQGLPLLLNLSFLSLAEEYEKLSDIFQRIAIGGEWYIGEHLQLRIGYNHYRRENLKLSTRSGWSGFSAGIALRAAPINVNYAILAFGVVSFTHRLGVTLQW